jgi:hypothetical protein
MVPLVPVLAAVSSLAAAAAPGQHTVPIAPGVDLPLVSLGGVPSHPSNWSLALIAMGRGQMPLSVFH